MTAIQSARVPNLKDIDTSLAKNNGKAKNNSGIDNPLL